MPSLPRRPKADGAPVTIVLERRLVDKLAANVTRAGAVVGGWHEKVAL
jgi:hypothetical protein